MHVACDEVDAAEGDGADGRKKADQAPAGFMQSLVKIGRACVVLLDALHVHLKLDEADFEAVHPLPKCKEPGLELCEFSLEVGNIRLQRGQVMLQCRDVQIYGGDVLL